MKLFPALVKTAAVAVLALPVIAADDARLSIAANTPEVDLTPRSAGRSFIRLPRLHYEFQVRTRCARGKDLESVMISVADTRKRFAGELLGDGMQSKLAMSVPAKQIAPLNIAEFCSTDSPGDKDAGLVRKTISGALSVQASMLCADAMGEQLTYASASLDVSLNCVSNL